ncbi:MAG TPA: UvrB/UvrC motif-containing protein [Pirellulaceae bacterium]|nr:UvrB/UvrC motif-containing protein [Pirellulaceae bacterium]HMO93332.1 UvrB/UvrC motif-containing protein [Pirellulaceae bacterium]HMP70103.1 UvrB/UvrC motif-containing protein [Pirellulaceae bacterium]
MNEPQDIDHILKKWEFDPFGMNVRRVQTKTRSVLQMRIEMGLLQLEIEGRPDGSKPHGYDTYLDYLIAAEKEWPDDYHFSEDECIQIDREFVQYYHRRICWLQLKEFRCVVADADHTLNLMDISKRYSPDEGWTMSHEQYRPFVLYHRTQAAALHLIDNDRDPEIAIEEINLGLQCIRDVFESFGAGEHFERDELPNRLIEFREDLRQRYKVGQTLEEKLKQAIADEQYEQAAKLRDQLAKRNSL